MLQLADTLTKVLDKVTSGNVRRALGFVGINKPEDWQLTKANPGKKKKNDHPENSPDKLAKQLFALNQNRLPVMESLDKFIKELEQGKEQWILLLELCTGHQSGFWPVHRACYSSSRIFVLQVTKHDDLGKCGRRLYQRIVGLKYQYNFTLVTHFSPPCTGGSPVQYLVSKGLDERLKAYHDEFEYLLKAARPFFEISDFRLFELSRQCVYWK